MKKTLLPLTIALAAPTATLADVTVYGRAHVSLDVLDNGADYSEPNVSSNASLLGFRADREFDGITALLQIERQLDFDSGAFTVPRDTFIGLQGDFGMVRVGQFDSPFKLARGPANLFGDQVGDIRNLTRVGDARFDERNSNTVHYQTPKVGDLQFNIAYSVSEPQTTQDGVDDEAVSLSMTYVAGPIDFAAAYETYGEDHSRGEREGVRVAAGYSLTSAVRLVAFFQSVDQEDSDFLSSEVFGVGGEYKLTDATSVKGQFMTRTTDIDDTDSNMVTLGVAHRIDSDLSVYANYGLVLNDDLVDLTPYTQARSAGSNVPAAAGEDASGFSVGLMYSFR